MNKKITTPELLSPAGNLEKMKTALAFGADAVYAGIPDFSLRTRINQFDLKGIKEATEYCHKKGKKIYITINIFAHNHHLQKIKEYIKKLKKIKVDALIISDPGIIKIAKKAWPDCEIHLSTQANCTNWQSAKFWFDLGIKRIVLGREAAYSEILEIRKKIPRLELEVFIHGAMCMAYSGRCFLSKYFNNRSANLGDCIQPCRWNYEVKNCECNNNLLIKPEDKDNIFELVEEQHGSYILNSQDLCLIKRIPELIEAGIACFKIEGRAKSAYYLANVIGAYRKVIDLTLESKTKNKKQKIAFLYRELKTKLVNRGYTDGFIFGNGSMAQELAGSHNPCEWEFCGQAQSIFNDQFSMFNTNKKYLTPVKVHNSLKVGDKIEIINPLYDIIKMELKKIIDPETGEELKDAHGGQNKIVLIETSKPVAEFSVIRRKLILFKKV